MKKIFSLLVILLPILLKSQSVDLLDQKNGFKDLKLGTLRSEMEDKISDCYLPNGCNVKGEKYYSIRDIPLESVNLSFYNDRLINIKYTYKVKYNDKVSYLLISTFGDPTNSYYDCLQWKGENVEMTFCEDDFNTSYVMLVDRELLRIAHKEDAKNYLEDF